ncbi:MAG: CapA family protein [Lachnospiraceae bacterium]|nr:CapA family protein [Lachnospiraceae bacterium]
MIIFCSVLIITLVFGSLGLLYYAHLRKQDELAQQERESQRSGAEMQLTDTDDTSETIDEQTTADTADEAERGSEAGLQEYDADEGVQENLRLQDDGDTGKPVTLVFTGDICFHDPFANMGAYRQRGSNIENCIDAVLLSEMRNADICMVNNEFPYSDRGAPLEGKTYAFRSKPSNVSILSDMGVDIAGIANNHAFDHGETAFLDTLDTLAGAGIPYVGGGRNIEEAAAPVIIEKGGMKIGFVAATQIERNWSPDTRGAGETQAGVMRTFTDEELARFLEAIKKADAMCDFLVVFVHWGSENTDVLDFRQTGQAAAYAEAGADLIVGAHPHCLQGLGMCGQVPVVYSLGNYWFNSKRVDTALLKVVVEEGRLTSLQMIPALQHDCRTDHLEGVEADRIIGYLNSISVDGAHLNSSGYLEQAW